MTTDMFSTVLAGSPPAGTGFVSSWPVRTGDVDPSNRLRFDGVARYLQDVGVDHLDATVFSERDPLWIVRRTVIDVLKPVEWPDRVRLHRWCSGLSTRWSNMRVRIESDKGGLIETEGFWINISPNTGMPTRISDEGIELLTETAGELRLKWKAWLTEPAPAETFADTTFVLRATDIDSFNHVNNAAYWHAIEELVIDMPDLVGKPHRAVIEYLSPILAREHITVRRRLDGGSLTVWFLVDDKVRTVAKVQSL